MSIFDDTRVAFQDKSTPDLKKAYWMFKAIAMPSLTNLGIGVMNFAVRNNLPFVDGILKDTLFRQFVGGETRESSLKVVQGLWKHHIGSIFDYAVEGKEDEQTFDLTFQEIMQNIDFAKGNPAIPFVVFKPTGFGRLDLYAKIQEGKTLSAEEEQEWQRIRNRFQQVCAHAFATDVAVMLDAEESWIQDTVDNLINEMMLKYNQIRPIVWNTIQMYRTGRLEYLAQDLARAQAGGYFLGYKFVRGAYMEKERARAAGLGYADPIQPDKPSSDKNFNGAVDFVFNHLDKISAFFGTHNEQSTQLIMRQMEAQNMANDNARIWFGQLYGMSDNITYLLGSRNYNACKYLPYGTVKDVIPYLTRRARENTSVAGQTGRELGLIEKELQRRKNNVR